jgi:hypothetical protein
MGEGMMYNDFFREEFGHLARLEHTRRKRVKLYVFRAREGRGDNLTIFVHTCFNGGIMDKKKENKGQQPRDHVLAIKMTADEKEEVMDYAEKNSVNVSALVRGMLSKLIRSTN